jgi:hypothetical protein
MNEQELAALLTLKEWQATRRYCPGNLGEVEPDSGGEPNCVGWTYRAGSRGEWIDLNEDGTFSAGELVGEHFTTLAEAERELYLLYLGEEAHGALSEYINAVRFGKLQPMSELEAKLSPAELAAGRRLLLAVLLPLYRPAP